MRSIITNQRVPTLTAAATPALSPNLIVTNGIRSGKANVPAIGVRATNQRKGKGKKCFGKTIISLYCYISLELRA